MDNEAVFFWRQLRTQVQRGDQIVAVILTAEGNWRRFRERIQPPGQFLAQRGEALLIDFVSAVEYHRWRHAKAGIEQHPVLNGEQDVVDRAVNPARRVVRLVPQAVKAGSGAMLHRGSHSEP